MNYKHIHSGHIISQGDYYRLGSIEQENYLPCYDAPTHSIDDDSFGGFLTTALVVESLFSSDSNDSSSSSDFSSSDSSSSDSGSSTDFGGGDSGGAGAGGDW